MKQECFHRAMRKKIYSNLNHLQKNLDYYNHQRPDPGKYCYGKTPMQTWQNSKKLLVEKTNKIAYVKNMTHNLDLTDNYKL